MEQDLKPKKIDFFYVFFCNSHLITKMPTYSNKIEEFKRKVQFQIDDSENMIKCISSALWTKHWKHDIKYNKLLLLRLTIHETITDEVDNMIGAKIKQCLFDSIETLQELVDVGDLDENLYLESVNELKKKFDWNESYINYKKSLINK